MLPRKVLVVDDEADIRGVCRRGLSQAGYTVTEAASGQEAIALARQEPFDLLLMDIKMPGMDGLETFRTIKALQPDAVGVVMTGYATVDNAIRAVNLGFSGYILKPFDWPQLEAAVQEALAKRERERDLARLRTLTSLARLSTTLTRMDLEGVLKEVARVAMEETRSDLAAVQLFAGDNATGLACYASTDGQSVDCWPELLAAVKETDLPLAVWTNEVTQPVVKAALQRTGLGSLAMARLALPEQMLGLLCVGRKPGASFFSAGDLEALKVLGAQVAIVVSNAHLFHQVVEEERLRQALQRYLSPRTVQVVLNGSVAPGTVSPARWMTVLLADVRDFSSLVERAEFATVIEALHEYFSAAVEVISAQQGVIDELSGDEVLASFDRTDGLEDDALRAVRAGLQMLERLDQLRAVWREQGRPSFDIGIGISSGPVAIGSIGCGERRAVVTAGRILNLAARSQALTRELDLRLIITQGTFERVRDYIHYRALGLVRLKGIAEPVGLYGVYGLRER